MPFPSDVQHSIDRGGKKVYCGSGINFGEFLLSARCCLPSCQIESLVFFMPLLYLLFEVHFFILYLILVFLLFSSSSLLAASGA